MRLSWLEPLGWKRLAPYLDEVLDLQPGERQMWVTDLATTQPEIAWALRAMLAELEVADAEGFLEQSPLVLLNSAWSEQASLTRRCDCGRRARTQSGCRAVPLHVTRARPPTGCEPRE